MMRHVFLRLCLLLVFAVAAPGMARAAILIVTDLGDTGGAGQLRTLIAAAAPGDTIIVPSGTIVLGAADGDLDVNKQLTIVGGGADLTIIDANSVDRVLEVGAAGDLVLSGVTLRRGAVHPETGGGGGAIRNDGVLRLVLSVVENSSSGGGGGMINGSVGTAVIESSTLRGNTASGTSGNGGGILNFGTLTLTNSTLSQNATLGPSASANGGGIANIGLLTLVNVTVSGNTAFGHGGGVFQGFSGDKLKLFNVTIAENEARLFGGGIDVMGLEPEAVNTIIAGNRSGTLGPDCRGTLNSFGHNLIEDSTDCTIGGTTTGNIIGVSARLEALALNGGPTATHGLRRNSPAIDACSAFSAPLIDQRGVARPIDGDGDGVPVCDIGAFERPAR